MKITRSGLSMSTEDWWTLAAVGGSLVALYGLMKNQQNIAAYAGGIATVAVLRKVL